MQRIVIVEKIKTIREGIKILINRFSDFECKDSFSDYSEFKRSLLDIKPDILLLDIHYSDISILDEITDLKKNLPQMIIVVLTLNEENELLFSTLLHGASAYINKNSPSDKLIRTLKDISNGKSLINSLIARKTMKFINDKKLSGAYVENELMLLEKVIEGNNLFAIKQSLKISNDDIKKTFNNIYRKLQSQVMSQN